MLHWGERDTHPNSVRGVNNDARLINCDIVLNADAQRLATSAPFTVTYILFTGQRKAVAQVTPVVLYHVEFLSLAGSPVVLVVGY